MPSRRSSHRSSRRSSARRPRKSRTRSVHRSKRSYKKSAKKSAKKSIRRSARRSQRSRRAPRKLGVCKSLLRKKIAINMSEFKKGKLFVSPMQAVAASYSQVKKLKPRCKRVLSRK